MQKTLLGVVFLLLCSVAALSQDPTVSWRDVRGIIIPGNVVGSGTGAVTGGMLPWSTSNGVAEANLTAGQLQFVVKGLVLAAGNRIGTRADITAVRGTLVCDTDGSAGGGNSVLVETPAVTLTVDGDAHFSGNVGSVPAVCSSEPDLAFLVRIAGVNGVPVNGPWIAYGAVRQN